ncbi:glycosyltransferase family 4 protein [Aneurinibacillus tyrosinisolvens]|uniref:glycosyltransferase family 4 protein n=1 Tax=Aneurinibacillus tyrosinisolvens TaxID=1443435 RepID=UPI00069BE8B1|nr:glycosyltransferase family 4 protein [Aneurinibacillus tyrosinisolvens]
MSRILFLTSDYPENSKGNLYVDLVDEFVRNGHQVDVISPIERRYSKKTTLTRNGNLSVLYIKSLNLRGNVNLIEKGIATLYAGYLYCYAINRYFKSIKYDIVICATLPITYAPVMRKLKRDFGTFSYLLQKDFFPQSAVDLGVLNKGSLVYSLFRWIEKRLYRASDMIGVISEKNIEFITKDNPQLESNKVEVCRNSIVPVPQNIIEDMKMNRNKIRAKYGIPDDYVVFVYGGNISRAQGGDFIIDVVKRFDECNNAFLLFVGSGNEFEKLKEAINRSKCKNIKIINKLSKQNYDELLASCDVGLVFLDKRFTIANIPSRTLSHLNMGQPILAATDTFTDFKEVILENNIGLWTKSDDVNGFLEKVKQLTNDAELRISMGENSRKYLLNDCDVSISYNAIIKHLN